ncbi:MAG: hypothetical protein CFK52_06995 [Chloracidobacterium sp. CP2_5A]|nr:MAG: hypothetical protein CFK52_06995 [Chloracidobacterium sp. CP2_5A]
MARETIAFGPLEAARAWLATQAAVSEVAPTTSDRGAPPNPGMPGMKPLQPMTSKTLTAPSA